ncbi:MAG: hypothetical protein FJZ87_14640 [Chloroflexi bacterium]|nr:hypothetical protein [Chloroflexota bacterium]
MSLVFLALTASIWSLVCWLFFSPPDLLIGHPVLLYGLLLFAAGLFSAAMGLTRLLKRRVAQPNKRAFLCWTLLFTAAILLFPPDLTKPYYPPAPMDGAPRSRSILPYPIWLPQVDAACSYGCIIDVCVRWIPGPSPQCPRPGSGGGCCTDYEQRCNPDCGDPEPPPILPPTITGTVNCALWGNDGWCRSNARLSLAASDPQGYSLSISGDAGGPFSCSGSCTINLPAGSGTSTYTVTASQSGMSASGSASWKYDPEPPEADLLISGTEGLGGWYVSPVTVTSIDSDAISGVGPRHIRINGGEWMIGASMTISTNGAHTLDFQAADLAGNTTTVSRSFKIDMSAPLSSFTSPSITDPVMEIVQVTGISLEETSGLAMLEFSSDGETWIQLSPDSGWWSTPWDTTEAPNGTYSLRVRGIDIAGNREDPVQIDVVVGNPAPEVRIPFSWLISDPAQIIIHPGPVDLKGAQIVIHDPQDRWPARRYIFDAGKIPVTFVWDRRFQDGTLAPPGRYRVIVDAWDKFMNTGEDTGTLIIPDAPMATVTSTPTPTITPSPSPTSRPRRTPTVAIATAVQMSEMKIPEQVTAPEIKSEAIWPAVGFLGLLAGLASASLSDPRPGSLRRMGRTITRIIDQEKRNEWKG